MASTQDISVTEAEWWLDADAYLQEQQVWAHGSCHCKYLLLQMFQHAAATGGRALAWHQGAGGPPVNPEDEDVGLECSPQLEPHLQQLLELEELTTVDATIVTTHLLRIQIPPHIVHPDG